jgi:hypothetical protein
MENSCQPAAFNDDQLIQAMACVVDGKTATYVSGPITTGPHFINWYVQTGFCLVNGSSAYVDALRHEVVSVNQTKIEEVTRQTRRTGRVVIEPATLEVKGWGQTDYVSFWLKVIDAFAREMVMVPLWQYSLGCCAEFRHAIRTGVAVRDNRGESIDHETGTNMILEAARDVQVRGHDFEFLMDLAAKLVRFADQD